MEHENDTVAAGYIARQSSERWRWAQEFATRLLIKDGEKEVPLPVEKVEWIEAAQYHCCIHSKGRQYKLRETISDLKEWLDPNQLVLIHRSSVVNVDQIKEICRDGAEERSISPVDGRNLKMSNAGRRRLLESGRV